MADKGPLHGWDKVPIVPRWYPLSSPATAIRGETDDDDDGVPETTNDNSPPQR